MPRPPKDLYPIHLGKDGNYHCWVTVGWNEEKQMPRRKHVKRADIDEAREEVKEILASVNAGAVVPAGRPDNLAEWLRYYVENIVKEQREYNTYVSYRTVIELHLIPRLGRFRLRGTRDVLQPDHVETTYAQLAKTGMAASYVRLCHTVLSRALKIAVKRDVAGRNVCTLVDGPSVRKRKPKPLPADVVKLIIATLRGREEELRWLLAILYALRQGETLGLKWDRIVWADGEPVGMWTYQQIQRRTWQHGCGDPAACVRKTKKCRTKECRSWDHGCGPQPEKDTPGACGKAKPWACPSRLAVKCRHHKAKECPPLCPADCTGHARVCPKRVGGGLVEVDLKSDGSERYVPFEPYVARLMKVRWAKAKLRAGEKWDGSGLIFTGPSGGAMDPRRDHGAWEQVLVDAKVPDAALHAARHTAATILVDSGAELSTVQEILGHSDIRVTRGYVEVAAKQKGAAMGIVGARYLEP